MINFLCLFVLIATRTFGYGHALIIAKSYKSYPDVSASAAISKYHRSFFGVGATTAGPVAPASTDLIISGVADINGSDPGDMLELYVIRDIDDLSQYAIGVANNGGGTDGAEFTFPADSYKAGDFIYVSFQGSSTRTEFEDFFGFPADYDFTSSSVSGNDAVELFHNGVAIDVWGDINVDGNGQPWEYTFGFGYRIQGKEPTTTFDTNDWDISGTGVFNGVSRNDDSEIPFPVGFYSPTP